MDLLRKKNITGSKASFQVYFSYRHAAGTRKAFNPANRIELSEIIGYKYRIFALLKP